MSRALCWLRRDLRLHDHHALAKALKDNDQTYLCFIFDSEILEKLTNKEDRRVTFIVESLADIQSQLQKYNAELIIKYGNPTELIPQIIDEYKIDSLYFNRDYEPYTKQRDMQIEKALAKKEINVFTFKDHVQYEKHEVLNQCGETYKVFTPYKKKWLELFNDQDANVSHFRCDLKNLAANKKTNSSNPFDWIEKCGFIPTQNILKGGSYEAKKQLVKFEKMIRNYKQARDYPALEGTSMLSVHLRMGTLSLRDLIRIAVKNKTEGSLTWLSELIWRDFYQMILDVYPQVEKQCFRPEYELLKWENNESLFHAWCEGQTGFPIVDAGMRQLNETGFMHNRLRMIVASFLTKTLLVDWKKGERYFAEKLLDYDMAANNGGWQWCASTGVDAQPYFRIFNPYTQSQKFDPKGKFIRQWCPELSEFSDQEIHSPQDAEFPEQDLAQCFIGKDYPFPIVSYRVQREKALAMFMKIKKANR